MPTTLTSPPAASSKEARVVELCRGSAHSPLTPRLRAIDALALRRSLQATRRPA